MRRFCLLLIPVFVSLTIFSQQLRSGIYRGVLKREDGNEIPFTFLLKNENKKPVIYISNASEKIKVDNIRQKKDSLFIEMPLFEASFFLVIQKDGSWKGNFIKGTRATDQVIPFTATPNLSYRFLQVLNKPVTNISGRWEVEFKDSVKASVDYAIAEFKQIGTNVTGTFLTATGDYRYLQGNVSGNKLMLSCFDGSHNYAFSATITKNNLLDDGWYFSSAVYKIRWTAKKNDNAYLPVLEKPVTLLPGETRLNFSFKDIDGKILSSSDEQFKNKVVIIQLMGSWCPNCMDETSFLTKYYLQNKKRGVEVVALAYEYSTDINRSQKSLRKFQQRFNVTYPILNTGVAVSDEKRTEKTLPQLTPIRTFPTTLILDKKGNVRQIHNTFYGPGTGVYYNKFKLEFENTIDELLKE
ncbi:MAG: TlpA family protein disulfide reductase [Sphingobacteriales bacterium]|nr:TlpA family protein disulfide reductase [Sphingobacteriales bacterium]